MTAMDSWHIPESARHRGTNLIHRYCDAFPSADGTLRCGTLWEVWSAQSSDIRSVLKWPLNAS